MRSAKNHQTRNVQSIFVQFLSSVKPHTEFNQSEANVLCNWCGTNLPDGSQFCLKCGQKASAAGSCVPPAVVLAPSTCSNCGASLPTGAASCPKCKHPVMLAETNAALVTVVTESLALSRARMRRRILLWLFAAVLLGAVLWAAGSDSPEAQQIQEFLHWSQAQTVVDTAIAVNPHSFSSRDFTVPPGALDVKLTGEFTASAVSPSHSKSNEAGKDRDNGIETFVLTESAFVVWNSGYSADSLYQSGLTAEGSINATLPSGAGVYDLVFSNRTSPHAKTVHTTVLLRYKSGWPNAVLRLKDRLWNWLGQYSSHPD